MNKLEEQLRKSRREGVSGLQPPPGGWEAVDARLTTLAPPSVNPPAAVTKVSKLLWWKWPLTIVGLAVTAGLLYTLRAEPATNDRTDQVAAVLTTAATATEPQPATAATSPEAMTEKRSAAAMLAGTADRPGAPASVVAPPAIIDQAVNASRVASRPRSAAVGQAPVATDGASTAASSASGEAPPAEVPAPALPGGVGLPVTDAANVVEGRDGTAAAGLTDGEAAGAKEYPVADLAGTTSEAAFVPVAEAFGLPSPTPALAGRPLPLLERATELPELPAVVADDPPRFTRKGKPIVRGGYQLSGTLSGHYLRAFQNSRVFSRDVTTGGADRLFVLPSGELLPVRFNRSDLTSNLRRIIRLDLGLNRQFSSGLLARAIIGVYYATNARPNDDFSSVTGLEVREDYYARRLFVPLELGFQYTFRKRYRFRPYIGVNLVSTLFNDSVERTTFFDAQTQTLGLISQTESTGVVLSEFDYSLTAGFQYRLSNRLSAGLALYAHSQANYFVESPFGVEVRYSLK